MADQREQIILDVDDRPATQASTRANAALDSVEKKAASASQKVTQAVADQSQRIVSITDRSNNAIQRNLDAFQRKLDSINKSPADRLAGDRDVLLKRVAGDPAAIQRATDLWSKFREEQDKIAKTQALTQFGSNVKQFVQNPLASAGTTVGTFAGSLGTLGLVAGGIVTAIVGIATAGFEAAKSLGQFGIGIRDVQVRTGLTAQQVGQFTFAAKAAGSDVSVFERTMRGLTEALNDNSPASDKARAALDKLGVVPRDLNGQLRPTADLLLDISEGFNKIPGAIDRDKLALDLFKKAGIDAAPVILDLAQNIKRARELGLGPSQAEVDKFADYNRTVEELDARWQQLKRSLVQPLAATVVFLFKGSDNKPLGPAELGKMGINLGKFAQTNQEDSRNAAINAGFGAQIRRDEGFTTAKLYEDAENAPYYQSARDKLKTFLDRDSPLEAAQEKLNSLKQEYDEARSSANQLVKGTGLLPDIADKTRAKVEATRAAYQGQSELVKTLAGDEEKRRRLADLPQKELAEFTGDEFKSSPGVGAALKLEAEYGDAIRGNAIAQKQFNQVLNLSIRKEVLDRIREQTAALNEQIVAKRSADSQFLTETIQLQIKTGQSAVEYQQQELDQSKEAELRALEFINATTLEQKRDLESKKLGIEDDAINNSLQLRLAAISDERESALASLRQQFDVRKIGDQEFTDRTNALLDQSDEQERQAKKTAAIKIQANDENDRLRQVKDERQLRLDTISAESDATIRLLELRGPGAGGEIELARQVASLRQSALEQELQLSGDVNRYQEASLKNQIDLRLQIAEESKREFDNIKTTVAGLTQTLFDKPSQFGRQLADTLKRSITEPVSQGIGGIVAKHLQPLLYGKDGQHGIAGKLAHFSKLEQPNHLGDVGLINGFVPVLIMNPQGSGGAGPSAPAQLFANLGGGLTSLFKGIGWGGGGSVPAGAVDSTISYDGGPSLSTGAAAIFGPNSILGGPGGTSGFAGDVSSGTGGVSSAAGPAGSILAKLGKLGIHGGSGTPATGILGAADLLGLAAGAGLLSTGLRSKNGLSGGLLSAGGGALLGASATSLLGLGGLWGGVLGAGAGLAASGLTRGGISGLAETTAGGALVGLQLGGPIGALIGAGVGAVAGGLRLLFKTASEKTRDKIKAIYGVNVTDQGILSQITQMIKQSYGGNIDVGIRSQEIRQLIQLYAMSTGQNPAGIAPSVQPSVFSNTGGQLIQQPDYVNGSPVYPTYGSAQTGGSPTVTVQNLTLQVGDGSLGDLVDARTTALLPQVIQASPRLISSTAAIGQTSSAGRRQAAANLLSPSFLTS